MSINLRKATPADIPILLDIEQSVAGTKLYSPMLDKGEWEEELKKGVVYIIEENALPVGNTSYEKRFDGSVHISGLVVSSQFQGRGIARAVLTRVLEEVENAKRIDLVTHPDNVPALKLYQSFGFVIESRKENYFGDGEPRLVLVLQK